MNSLTAIHDRRLVERLFDRVVATFSAMGGKLDVQDLEVRRETTRPAGEGKIHISFRIAFRFGEERGQGCLLMPLPDAATMAGVLMMLPASSVDEWRESQDLEESAKDAVMEVGNLIGGAFHAVLEDVIEKARARFAGCQGVRPGVRPAFPYEEGTELLVARASGRVGEFPRFPLLFMMPVPPELRGTREE